MNIQPRAPRPLLSFGPAAPDLALGRVHEATGPAATVFAALAAGRMSGPVLWIRPAWAREGLGPEGLATEQATGGRGGAHDRQGRVRVLTGAGAPRRGGAVGARAGVAPGHVAPQSGVGQGPAAPRGRGASCASR